MTSNRDTNNRSGDVQKTQKLSRRTTTTTKNARESIKTGNIQE